MTPHKFLTQLFMVMTLASSWSTLSYAVPLELNYGGRFVEASGKPVSGPVDLSISFYQSETGTDLINVTVPQFSGVTLDDGIFQINLSLSDSDLNTIFATNQAPWIEVKDLTHNVTYPRQRYSLVPYASGSNACISRFGVDDMIGNLWEWTDLNGMQAGPGGVTAQGGQQTPNVLFNGDSTWNLDGSAYGWNGTSYGWANGAPAAASRGGSWDNSTAAGAFALNLYNSGSSSAWNLGFRCARPR